MAGCQNQDASAGESTERLAVTRGSIAASVNATGYVEPNEMVPITFQTQGIVTELLVAEGDPVEADQLLARLDTADLDLAVRAAEAQLAAAKAQRDALRSAASESEIAAAEAAVTSAQAARDALPDGAPEAQIAAADAQLAQAQAQLDRLSAGASKAQIAAADAQVDQSSVTVEQAKAQLARTELRAPTAGVVTSLALQVGVPPSPTQPALILVDLSAFEIRVAVDEVDIVAIEVGDPVAVQVEALPDTPIEGTVSRIATGATVAQGIVTYPVTVTLDAAHAPALKPGMSATVDIITETRDNVLLLPSRALSIDRATGELYVEREVESQPVRTTVTVGLRDNGNSEILTGLEEGQYVIIRVPGPAGGK